MTHQVFQMVADIGSVALPSTLWEDHAVSNPMYTVSNIYGSVMYHAILGNMVLL